MAMGPEGVGPAIRRFRHRAGWTQRELEQRAGIGTSSVSRYERGEELPSIPTLMAILGGLGLGLHDLADALGDGAPASGRSGRARGSWVEGLRRQGIDAAVVESYAWANSDRDDPAGEADLIASAQEAARLIAEAALEQRRRTLAEIDPDDER